MQRPGEKSVGPFPQVPRQFPQPALHSPRRGWRQHRTEALRRPKAQHAGGTPALPGVAFPEAGRGCLAGNFSERSFVRGTRPLRCSGSIEPVGGVPGRKGTSLGHREASTLAASESQALPCIRLFYTASVVRFTCWHLQSPENQGLAVSGATNKFHPTKVSTDAWTARPGLGHSDHLHLHRGLPGPLPGSQEDPNLDCTAWTGPF